MNSASLLNLETCMARFLIYRLQTKNNIQNRFINHILSFWSTLPSAICVLVGWTAIRSIKLSQQHEEMQWFHVTSGISDLRTALFAVCCLDWYKNNFFFHSTNARSAKSYSYRPVFTLKAINN